MPPHILIGCPTYQGQAFCLDRFLEGLRNLKGDFDILFVDNSEGTDYFEMLKQITIENRKVIVLRDEPQENRIMRIISSRNACRYYFLKNSYDYLFFLDTDMIPPPDALQQLLKVDADIASGNYLCRQEINGKLLVLPALYKHHGNQLATLTMEEAKQNNVIDIAVCGLGCCLIKRKVLEKISFRPFTQSKTGGEDVAFCVDAQKEGCIIKANLAARCSHRGKQEVLHF